MAAYLNESASQAEPLPAELSHQQALEYSRDLVRIYRAEKARRQELELANQLQDTVWASIPTGLIVVNDSLRIQQANPAFHSLFELEAGAALGQPLGRVLPSDELIQALQALPASEHRHHQIEVKLQQPVGRILNINVARLETGSQTGWILVLHDRTAHRQLEYQKIEFINIAAHELRTPLTSVLGLSELLVEGLDEGLNSEQKECLKGIYTGARRLSNIVDELIAFSQFAEGSAISSFPSENVDLVGLVRDVVGALHQHAEEKQVRLEAEIDLTELQTRTNPRLLAGALHQLVLNGINFNKADGRVTVTLKRALDQAYIHIDDTGIGIPQTDLDTIFQPFYQVEDHNIRHTGGLGLGLAIVRRSIARLGGTISAESTLGSGTSFTVTLPIAPHQAEHTAQELSAQFRASHQQSLAYARDIQKAHARLQAHFVETIKAIQQAIEARDRFLSGHTVRVTRLALMTAKAMGYSERQLKSLEIACQLHDVGKIAAPDTILHHADAHIDRDYAVIQHIEAARDILSSLDFLSEEIPVVLAHHAYYNGLGYPDGLSGEDIPHPARILAVANDYDVMVSPRLNQEPLSQASALAVLQSGAGTQWDPEVVAMFTAIIPPA